MKSELTTEALLFYNKNNEVVKRLNRTAFTGDNKEVLVWGDFDKTFFTYDQASGKILLLPQSEYGEVLFNQPIGNKSNQTITFCGLKITNMLSLGKFDYIIGLKRKTDTFIYKVEVSIYVDTLKLSDAGSFHISTGKVNIAVGVYKKNNDTYIIVAPYESVDTLSTCAIYSKDPIGIDVTTFVLGIQPSPTEYVII